MGIPWQSSELGLSTLTVVAMVQSLVGELRSHMVPLRPDAAISINIF